MTTIITRASKGSILSNTELDTTFTNLNTAKMEDVDTRSTIQPSLSLDFTTGVLDPRITYSRASTAGGYYDGKSSAMAEQNLVIQSQDFTQSVWSKIAASVTANSITAPDGTTTGTTLTSGANVSSAGLVQSITLGTGVTFSVYAKIGTTNFLALTTTSYNIGLYAVFNLNTGAVSSSAGCTASITAVANGWYRCTMANTTISGGTGLIQILGKDTDPMYAINYAGSWTVGNYIYLWGAQLEQRANVTAYTATTSTANTNYIPVIKTANTNVPRFDYDPIAGTPNGFLIEEQRTNLMTYSSTFLNPSDASIYSPFGNFNQNATISPDGTQTSCLLINNYTGQQYSRLQRGDMSAANNSSYTISIYAKAANTAQTVTANNRYFGIQVYDGTVRLTTFDLFNGVVANNYSGLTGSITSVGNGWYRCSTVYTATLTSSPGIGFGPSTATTRESYANSGVYLWGAQYELGAFASTYIPTPFTYTSRASTATYLGANGYIQTANTNIPRYQLSSIGTPQLLVESAASNMLYPSTPDFGVSYGQGWNKNWNGVMSALIPGSLVSPDGTYTATKVVTFSASEGLYYRTYSLPTVSTAYTGSLWVYSASALTLNTTVSCSGGTAWVSNNNNTTTLVPNTWTRIQVNVTSLATITATSLTFSCTSTSTNSTFYVWGAQLENSATATSYIPSVQVFTSRSSNATFYDASTTAKAEENLLPYSQQILYNSNAAWGATAITYTANTTNTTAPDGTNTATSIVATATNNIHNTNNQAASYTEVSGQLYTMSVYAKANTSNFIQFVIVSGGSGQYANFNVASGIVGTNTGIYATCTAITNNWYRCVFTYTGSANGSVSPGISIGSGATDTRYQAWVATGTESVYLWGAQVEQRANVTPFISTGSTAITNYIPAMQTANTNIARFDYDPVTRISKGLMVEPAATNLINYSSSMSSFAYGSYTINVQSADISPDSNLNASIIREDSSTNVHWAQLNLNGTYPAGTIYTYSTYIKQYSYNTHTLSMKDGTNGNPFVLVTFNLSTVTAGTPYIPYAGWTNASASIIAVGNGWYRCSITATISGSAIIVLLQQILKDGTSYAGNGYNGTLVWGAQLEAGSVATSYIPTIASTVTRAADIATSTAQTRAADVYSSATATRIQDGASMTKISDWFNKSQGSFYVETKLPASNPSQTTGIMSAVNSSNVLDSIECFSRGNNIVSMQTCVDYQWLGGSYSGLDPVAVVPVGVFNKLSYSYTSNGVNISVNGANFNNYNPTFPSAIPYGINTFLIGTQRTNSLPLNGWIKKIQYYPVALANTQLQSITI